MKCDPQQWKSKGFLTIRISLILMGLVSFVAVKAQQNTILIIADDVSPDYFGCYSTTTDTATAPNISALAKRGVKFTKAWASPVCSVTRAGMLTGKYPFRTGIGSVILNANSTQIDTSEKSIAKLLKNHASVSYNTACVGKWHLNNNGMNKRMNPHHLGFDYYSGNFNGAISDYYQYDIVTNGQVDTARTYATTKTINDAIDWMDTMDVNKPFFIWLALNAPHTPFHLPPDTLCNTTGLNGGSNHINNNRERYFKAAIEAMDTEIGRLFNYLIANNHMDSTNIIFIGDNGNPGQVAQIANSQKAKGSVYDYGVRVPMIVAGPSVVNGNRTSSELVNTPDLYGTILEMSGLSNWRSFIPSTTTVDSKPITPILKQQNGVRSWIFTELFTNPATAKDGKTIRNEDYHLIRFDNGTEEFYNQTWDVEEDTNLLLNTSAMTATDIANYHFLCDSMTTLIGSGTCLSVSLEEHQTQDEIQVSPNPASSILSIKSNTGAEKKRVEILNIQAERVAAFDLKRGESKIDVSSYPNGVYLMVIKGETSVTTRKFVKE